MPTYTAPLSEFQRVLFDVLEIDKLHEIEIFADLDRGAVEAFLQGAARICEEVIQPLNQVGDIHGCSFDQGQVRTPPGFKEAYRALSDGGWIGLWLRPEDGGQGLPAVLSESFYEILCSANMALSGFVELSEAIMTTIAENGSAELRALYLPKLASGRWTGAMHLTEAHAGSDLGMVRTRAEPADNDTYRIYGQKIFITNAEHDLAENIVHLVLARLPGAPAGTRGLSLFLVPKFIPNPDGSLGERNAVECISLEHKMGLKGAPTGTFVHDGAVGWLIGKAGGGISAMFSMVNDARLGVALQGLGIAELAWQNASRYATERLQGRAIGKSQAQPAEPIINHPDVRRMLALMAAFIRPARALALNVALQIDLSRHHPDMAERGRADQRAALLTPVIKSLFTDWGSTIADLCIQVHGGHGFVRDTGVEQFFRDVRVTRIYEGTNAIQAIDLIKRKIALDEAVEDHFSNIRMDIDRARAVGDEEITGWADMLEQNLNRLTCLTAKLREMEFNNDAVAGANDYLEIFGLVSLGAMWFRMLAAGNRNISDLRCDKNIARVFYKRILPKISYLFEVAQEGSEDLMSIEITDFCGA